MRSRGAARTAPAQHVQVLLNMRHNISPGLLRLQRARHVRAAVIQAVPCCPPGTAGHRQQIIILVANVLWSSYMQDFLCALHS